MSRGRTGERARRADRERVVIAGGGPAGAVAALVLARRGVPVTVLERRAAPGAKVGETLPPTVAPLLAHLGLDRLLAADGHLRSHGNRAVWGSAEPYDAPFLANPHGAGWHVDRRRFEARLAAAAVAAGAEWRWSCEVVRCAPDGEGWRLEVRSAGGEERAVVETLAARYLADATGRAARLARRLGARRLGARRVRHDRLVGVAALLGPTEALRDTYTLVESTPDGWWYSALLADGRLAVAWMTDGDLLHRELRAGDPEPWWRLLRRTTATRERVEAHGGTVDSPLRRLPAETSHLDAVAG
ncbi:MAG TPA: FAD-dependent monooxygenase, partial [Thermoanaerobaculia bacterium]|nr:FAD-dependent monooxygenase [Thermoanaerobaculia bacterium]